MSKRKNVQQKKPHLLSAFLISFTLSLSLVYFMGSPTVTKGDTVTADASTSTQTSPQQKKYVVIYLQKMQLELHDGDTIVATLPLLSQGKPGSYYETIGGDYVSDYKMPLHFSSIGHVFMPHSVHLFGNYFIHGIPYYPDGAPVSSTYSGGCIRLTNENAKIVYDFVEPGTHIIVTRNSIDDFAPTATTSSTFMSNEMTSLMTASISLEFLTQDNQIPDIKGRTLTTRKALLPLLINTGDSAVASLYAKSMGTDTFVASMNEKAKALGLTNTHFDAIDSPAVTSLEDYIRFTNYINTYKSYLMTIQDKEAKTDDR